MFNRCLKISFFSSVVLSSVILSATPAHAYVGPGAGFAFLGSAMVFLMTLFLGFLTVAFWPIQWAVRKARGFGVSKKARTRRAVIVGIDGLDPKLTERLIAEGKMPK